MSDSREKLNPLIQRKKQVHKRDNAKHIAQLARFVQYLRFTGKISPTYKEYPSYRFTKANLSTIFKLIFAFLVIAVMGREYIKNFRTYQEIQETKATLIKLLTPLSAPSAGSNGS